MGDHKKLRSLVFGEYKSCRHFSMASNINIHRVYRLLEGKSEPSLDEMRHIANMFQLSPAEAWNLFFTH